MLPADNLNDGDSPLLSSDKFYTSRFRTRWAMRASEEAGRASLLFGVL
jgi:hypothetical protein